ncbi:protein sidekick-2 isoform X1 [Melanotaenia boesemani]|uniref:protein sidekick-2 isoform X1 n=1 Tax=Melanotaenia boesemani TaxID=1250792 RepID=UPI001C05AB00|nr:protein sidekick-2 isoform X1 [Melanotaenia boesemani]
MFEDHWNGSMWRATWILFFSLLIHSAQAQDDVPPYFKTEPVRSQLHLERNRLVLTCMAEGSWPLEFKWIHNNTELTRFSLEYRYLIPSLDRSHAGFYRCIVRNRVGALLQRRTEVQVAFMGSFEEGERSQSVSQGEGAVIPAPLIRSFPQPQVTWFRDGRKIPPSSRIAITLDNTLVILSTVAPDAGRYYVQAVNDKNGENKTSQPITLSVENVGGPADPIAPTIIIPPRNTSVVTGTSEVTMECVANARPLIKLSISWRKNGVMVTSGLSDFNRRLTILSPLVSDAGYYECEAILRSSSVPSVSAGAYLHVLEPPQFIKEPEKHITAEMEKVVDIPCQARGVPQPDIVWYKDALPINPVKTPRYRVLVGGSLQVNGLLPDDTGMFQCFARNLAGEVQTNTYLAVTSIAPNITAGPSDSTVIDGMSVILHCETSGAPRPAITWQKGERVLASGSVQLPRFTLLESGSLLISPSHISDAGTYTCMASNSRGIDEASADLIVWARTRITTPPQDQSVIKGTKAIMYCGVTHDPSVIIRHVWEKDSSVINVQSIPRMRLDADGTLHISQTWSGDIGTYTCRVTSVGGNDSRSAHLRVRQLPHAPENPTAMLSKSEKRAIDLAWAKPFDGNSPLIRYILEVSENNAPWAILLANIEPESTAVTVNGLIPARSYQFRLCAVNDVGKGQFSKETDRVSLPEEPPSAPPQNVIASGRTNQSIMIQWQPPQESHQNGILRGYIIRYRLTGLPVDYQIKNISSPDVTTLLLEDLIIWTNYEIEVAAFNGAGLGAFSHKVTEWTLQGVPTIPPGNVQVEAVNSTAIRFTWTAPNPQFINGINQGYKLLAWEPGKEEDVAMVTVRPNFQDSVHVGYVTGLKKFTEYFTSVLCFTTPGDGPRSPPKAQRTHEDTPGAVGHLSFTEILDTSLKVSWSEPGEKNGVLTGYRISWEEFNRTNTRVTHYLPNVTLEYRVTGLTALTTYTIEVAGMTSKGQGQLSSSTISSGVPPELPGPPTNLAISNIGPRSVMLQFKPGYDGKTSISRWLVEAQVGAVGENEDWTMVHQVSNEPEARSLEVPVLNPYTFYRFRMRQVNIVGTSPPSQPSRKIQTLPAPPDMAPANVTLRTASETSLWLRWMPLPEWEYNGNAEQVGYRVQYYRAGSQGRGLTHIISDRLEREFTIEDLEEWMEYEVRVQAVNGIGMGPWSQPVRGRTRESVPSSGPTNVSAFATTSSSILVRWFEVPEPDRNGLILGYKVVYKEKDSDSVVRSWTVEGNTTHSVQLTGLGKYVLYEIKVLAFTRIGDGRPSSPPILERTLDDVPGPPVGILFPEVRTNSVRLIWQSPAQPNGIILAYQITYHLNSTNSNTATVDVLNPSARQYMVTNLKPESVYVFRITAQTRKGWGEPAEALVVTTEKRARPQPTSRPRVPQANVQARQVFLSWEPGSDGLSPVRYYTVQLRELPENNWTVHSASVNHEASSYIVSRLKPFTSYQFRVKATNDIGDSEYSEESEAITTLQDAPDEAPTILSVTPHTTTSVLIRWQPPSEEKINGISLGFRIRYRELLYDRLRSYIHTVNSVSAWAELTAPYSIRNLSDSTLIQYELDKLSKHKRYEIRMSVYNAVGEGPTSPPQEVFVGEAVPTAPPQNVAIQSATATQLDVTWDPPPVDAQNGDIQGYKIYFWEFQRKNDTERLRTLFMPEAGVKLKNLTGYTTYMISVAPFNAAGDGPRSPPTRGRTQQAAPSAPSFIHFSELTTTSVNVSWGEPTFPNGIIEGYRLVYEPLTPVDESSVACADCLHSPSPPGVSKTVTVDVKGSGPLWLKLRDLAEGVTYNFRIRAKTFIYGPEVEANITTGPGEGAPGPPGEPFITRYSSALTIHWTSGDPGRAPITRYVIEARPSDEGLWDILIKDIPKDATSHTFNMEILKQGISYDFRVIGVNDYGYGSPSLPSPSISAQKVAPFYEEWWFLVVVALVGLIFILLLVFILIIRGQSKKYAKKSESVSLYLCPGNNSNCNALTHGDMVSLDEGRFPALELNNRRLSVKNSFCRKNGVYTRSPPRPSPGSLHYSDEDVSTKYNDLIPAESSSLTEKPSEISDSQEALVFSYGTGGLHTLPLHLGSDSEYEVDPNRQKTHSFVNHYISDPTYYNSWRRQQKGISRAQAYSYTESESGDPEHCAPPPLPPLPPLPPQLSSPSPQPQQAQGQPQGQGSLFRPKGSRTPTPSQQSSNPPSQHSTLYRPPSSLAPGSRAPIAGFSSFV